MSELLTSVGFEVAAPDDTPCLVVSVRRAPNGIAVVEAWLLGDGASIEEDFTSRAMAKAIADGISSVGETLVTFARTRGQSVAVSQVANGLINR